MKTTIIIDLDGTLCNSGHRQHYAVAKDWAQFHGCLMQDEPNADVQGLIAALPENWTRIALTARPEPYRTQTIEWLLSHGIAIDTLLMRPANDFNSDTIVKPALLNRHFGSHEVALQHVAFILDDRDAIVEAWRNLGYRCWQVQPGGY